MGMIGASSCCLSTSKSGGSDGDSKIVGAPHFRFGLFVLLTLFILVYFLLSQDFSEKIHQR